ncbi:MAG: glycosyltransferase family 4 protein [Acidimicrobiales bacterium]|nr:glycosyltransferase family 4 protein [Acidimicrobiales bacterium]
MRVLVSAYACEPGLGSEPGLGWGIVEGLAGRHELHVLTATEHRDGVEAALAARPLPGVDVEYLACPGVLDRAATTAYLRYLHYSCWQAAARRRARSLVAAGQVDVVHHATYTNAWVPPLTARLGVPFVWDAGGCDPTPLGALPAMSARAAAGELARNAALASLGRVARAVAVTDRTTVVTASSRARWPGVPHVVELALGGLTDAEADELAAVPARAEGPFRTGSAGRLLGWKGFTLGLRAFAALAAEDPTAEHWIVGDGGERSHLEAEAARLGVADRVRILGWRPRAELPALLAQLDVVLHPSLHDQFAFSVLEAMAAGRPVVALDVGGPARLLAPGGGVLVPVGGHRAMVAGLVAALRGLRADADARRALGEQARRVALGRWRADHLGEVFDGLFREATAT